MAIIQNCMENGQWPAVILSSPSPRRSLQKLLNNLMPTADERAQIVEARAAQPDVPLGPAEEFLHTLSSIPELQARLSLWRFNYVFQQAEEVWPSVNA